MSSSIRDFTEHENNLSHKSQISLNLATFLRENAINLSASHTSVARLANLAQELPLRILLAEDGSVDRLVALRILQFLGYQPDFVVNGVELLAAVRQQHYDLVLTDIQMPQMGGLEAARCICQEWLPEERPYIIALTSETQADIHTQCLNAGMDDYINKPLKISKLIDALLQVATKPLPNQAGDAS